MNVAILAGMASTSIFAGSTLPMLIKAARTKDLRSYSLGNILLSNIGNLIHSVYVFHLPAGPIWLLHSFYLVAAALMLYWYLLYQVPSSSARRLWHAPRTAIATVRYRTGRREPLGRSGASLSTPSGS